MGPFDKQSGQLPWNQTSHYPGYQVHASPFGLVQDTGEVGWIPMGSSWVSAISWRPDETYKLWVRFHDGHVEKFDATEDDYDDMFGASSPGRFVHYRLNPLSHEPA